MSIMLCVLIWIGQTEQMGRIVNELDTIQFSIKKASQLVKEIGRQVSWFSLSQSCCPALLFQFFFTFLLFTIFFFSQVATDKCIMLFLFLIVCGVIAIIVVKVSSSVHLLIALRLYNILLSSLFDLIVIVLAKIHFKDFCMQNLNDSNVCVNFLLPGWLIEKLQHQKWNMGNKKLHMEHTITCRTFYMHGVIKNCECLSNKLKIMEFWVLWSFSEKPWWCSRVMINCTSNSQLSKKLKVSKVLSSMALCWNLWGFD